MVTWFPWRRGGFCPQILACAGLGVLACAGPLDVDFQPSHSLTIVVGRELDVTLGTLGPGEYLSPPTISSSAIKFLDAELVGPNVPAGPTQRFRFVAMALGEAVITFRHTAGNPVIEDTVSVH